MLADKRQLRINQAALFLLSVALVLVGRRITLWPIMTWPVYSHYSQGFPDPTVDAVSLRLITTTGETYTLAPADLFGAGRTDVAKRAIAYAFDDTAPEQRDANRAYLSQLVSYLKPDIEISVIQGYRTYWQVEPLSVPPLVYDTPTQVVRLGSFRIADYTASKPGQQ
ncbi:hypothetical protein [Almyronema epifaneia]|uniref:Uncharacterized protein n=1 Tax=Almyronema epifaneia S1 TaxID=2991925 RepID=A0ABW6IAG5_9CYAN